MTDIVNHPPHYTSHPSGIECIHRDRHWTTTTDLEGGHVSWSNR